MRVAGADALDDPDALVTGDEGRFGLDRPLAARGMDVCVAESAGLDADEHLLGARRGDRYVLKGEGLVEAVDDRGLHRGSSGR
jgi:hypothetical protein